MSADAKGAGKAQKHPGGDPAPGGGQGDGNNGAGAAETKACGGLKEG